MLLLVELQSPSRRGEKLAERHGGRPTLKKRDKCRFEDWRLGGGGRAVVEHEVFGLVRLYIRLSGLRACQRRDEQRLHHGGLGRVAEFRLAVAQQRPPERAAANKVGELLQVDQI